MSRINHSYLHKYIHENCMVKPLQSRESISPSCEKCIVELSDSVWTQLENNEWIYFTPTSKSIAILCNDRNPAEVALTGMGKLRMNTNCRGYNKSVLLQTHSVVTVNSSMQAKDLMSGVNLEYECYEELGMKINLSSIHLNTNSKHIVSHLDDLNIASLKIAEVERIIMEQEWERLHTTSHDSYVVYDDVMYVTM